MRPLAFLVALLSVAFTAVLAGATALAPTKGSQIVALQASGPCPFPGYPNATGFSVLVKSDGSRPAFAIPAKQVLVLTEVVATTNNLIAGDVFGVELLVGSATVGTIADLRFEPASQQGTITVRFAPPTGMVIKSGNFVCIDSVNFTHFGFDLGVVGIAHGFLAPDK
jgi:hypothetical protein